MYDCGDFTFDISVTSSFSLFYLLLLLLLL